MGLLMGAGSPTCGELAGAVHFLGPASQLCPLPRGLSSLTFTEDWKSSCLVLNSVWKLLEVVPDRKAGVGLVGGNGGGWEGCLSP